MAEIIRYIGRANSIKPIVNLTKMTNQYLLNRKLSMNIPMFWTVLKKSMTC